MEITGNLPLSLYNYSMKARRLKKSDLWVLDNARQNILVAERVVNMFVDSDVKNMAKTLIRDSLELLTRFTKRV